MLGVWLRGCGAFASMVVLTAAGVIVLRDAQQDRAREERADPGLVRLRLERDQWARTAEDRGARLAEAEAANAALRLELDRLRRGAVWVPAQPNDLGPGDRIPPQNVPTAPRD